MARMSPKKYGDKVILGGDKENPLIPERAILDIRIVALLMKAGLSETDARLALADDHNTATVTLDNRSAANASDD